MRRLGSVVWISGSAFSDSDLGFTNKAWRCAKTKATMITRTETRTTSMGSMGAMIGCRAILPPQSRQALSPS